MVNLDNLAIGFAHLIQPTVLLACLGGTIIGIIIGAIPGLGAAVGMALLLPVIFFWPPEVGLVLLTSLWMADNFGGSISAILLGVPGTAGAIFTVLDGHAMAKKGRGIVAIGIALMASAIGGLTGALLFLILAPPIASVAVKFGPSQLTWLAIVGLTVVSSASAGRLVKGIIAACIGITLGLVGIHPLSGFPRFTFGTVYLMDALDVVLLALGIFAVADMLQAGAEAKRILQVEKMQGNMFDGIKLVFRHPATLIRSSLIGSFVGALPGAGITTATPLAYQQTVAASNHPETFGKGNPEGVLAPEAANNAVQGGALIPTLALGIPGSMSSVIFLGGIIMYGIRVGPHVFVEQGPLVWAVWWALVVSILFFWVFGVSLSKLFAKVAQVPFKYLVPVVFAMVVGGAYSIHLSPLDLVTLIVLGVIAYFLARHRYPVVPLALAFILGPLAEKNFFRALIISDGSYSIFFQGIINPILIAIALFSLGMYFRGEWKRKKRKKTNQVQEQEQ